MWKHSIYQKLFKELPPPYTITKNQIRDSYQLLYDKLLDYFNKKDFHNMNKLLEVSKNVSSILQFKLPTIENESDEDFLPIDFVQLLYKIITIYPVQYYKTQLLALLFLNEFLTSNKKIKGLKLEWKPFFKVMKYYLLSEESFFIRGSNIVVEFNDVKNNRYISKSPLTFFFEVSAKISQFFPDEIQEEKNGLTVTTSTTEQLFKKFIPKISPNGHQTPAYLAFLSSLFPPFKSRYNKYIEYLLIELNDTSDPICIDSILSLLLRIIECNIEDDFSFIIPVLSEFITIQILSNKFSYSSFPNRNLIAIRLSQIYILKPFSFNLSRIIVALFISPHTRKRILELLKNFFISFKKMCHPSNPSQNQIGYFVDSIVLYLRKALRKLEKKKEGKFYYDMRIDLKPSQDELHELLTMTSELKIMNFKNCINHLPVLVETKLDPLLIDHYFEIAGQCINMIEAYGIAKNGWTIMTSLVMSIDTCELIRDNFSEIFLLATNNFYRPEIQSCIADFLSVSCFKVPFNREKTVKGCESVDFPQLAYSFFSNLMSIFRSLPSAKDKLAEWSKPIMTTILTCTISLLQNCDEEVKNEIFPIFKSLPTDESMCHSVYLVELIIVNYAYFAGEEKAKDLAKSFKKQIDLYNNDNLDMLRYLLINYSLVSITSSFTKENVKKTTDLILKYTKSEDEKIRDIAWSAISDALNAFDCKINIRVDLKEDKIINNILENAKLEDFVFKWDSTLDLSDLAFEIFNPVFDELLTLKDPFKIINILNDLGSELSVILRSINVFNEGEINDTISEGLNNPIYCNSSFYKKSIPFKDKLLKCINRILSDFKENDFLITKIVKISKYLFKNMPSYEDNIGIFQQNFIPFDHSNKYYNSEYLFNFLQELYNQRREMIIVPLNDDLKLLFSNIVELCISKSKLIQQTCFYCLIEIAPLYSPCLERQIVEILDKTPQISINELILFLNIKYVWYFLLENNKYLCKTFIIILDSFDLKDKENMIDLNNLLIHVCISSFPFQTPKSNTKEFIDLLNEIESNYMNKNPNLKTYNFILMMIIFFCLKNVNDVSDGILEFIIKNITHFDQDISPMAQICLSNLLSRKVKYTKERIEVKSYPSMASFPNIFEGVKIKLPPNGIYFPVNLKTSSSNALLKAQSSEVLATEYSLETDPLSTLNLNMLKETEINEDVKIIFESIKNIEIEWNTDEKDDILYHEYFSDPSNGFFMYKDHYYRKNYEYNNNKILMDNLENILASALYSTNEKDLNDNFVHYTVIWEKFVLILGPFCFDKLSEIFIKYLSEYYPMNPKVTSKILHDLIGGFVGKIRFWTIADRIKFIKLILLPFLFIMSSNQSLSPNAELIIHQALIEMNPFCLAPLFKILFELTIAGPSMPIYNRSLITLISQCIFIRPDQFMNTLDQIKVKLLDPFVEKIGEYGSIDIGRLVNMYFSMLNCCSFSNKKSPIYSEKIEIVKSSILESFERILQMKDDGNVSLKKNLNRALTSSFYYFSISSYDLRHLLAPLISKHLSQSFEILKGSKLREEEQFVQMVGFFMSNSIFISNTKIELDFVTELIKAALNMPLPLQFILLDLLNKMIESNIVSIPVEDYPKYECLLLNYNHVEKVKNLGNELRLKIAKVFGIFQVRNFTLDQSLTIDDKILKAASLILNSYLFDENDKRVSVAFDFLEEACSGGNQSKDREFFEKVSDVFITRHTDYVLNSEVQNLVIQYKNLVTPSYIC